MKTFQNFSPYNGLVTKRFKVYQNEQIFFRVIWFI